ncbi:MAG: hypothetical protein MJ001_06505, partial [Paludibacteraceae bacterium]|nr:hypothetical protein [Paludibacteraceae bacterium]
TAVAARFIWCLSIQRLNSVNCIIGRMDSIEVKTIYESWEVGLPSYLQNDLDAYKEGRRNGSTLLDCLWCELYGSINGAEIDDQLISHEQAQYLRDKFLWHKLGEF